MFKTIVAGTDGSKNAEEALVVAAELAKVVPDSSVHVVGAYRPLPESELREIASELPDEFRSLLHASYRVESTLDSARGIFTKADVKAEFHEINDDPTDAILDICERVGADLIVVGSRGEGAAKRLLHGSVSTKLLHHAPCSILVIKESD